MALVNVLKSKLLKMAQMRRCLCGLRLAFACRNGWRAPLRGKGLPVTSESGLPPVRRTRAAFPGSAGPEPRPPHGLVEPRMSIRVHIDRYKLRLLCGLVQRKSKNIIACTDFMTPNPDENFPWCRFVTPVPGESTGINLGMT